LYQDSEPLEPDASIRQSMTPWFNEAARDRYTLDRIYWSWLDAFCFGAVHNRTERSYCVCRADVHRGLDKFVNLSIEVGVGDRGGLEGRTMTATGQILDQIDRLIWTKLPLRDK
jgi:hypothetical protein